MKRRRSRTRLHDRDLTQLGIVSVAFLYQHATISSGPQGPLLPPATMTASSGACAGLTISSALRKPSYSQVVHSAAGVLECYPDVNSRHQRLGHHLPIRRVGNQPTSSTQSVSDSELNVSLLFAETKKFLHPLFHIPPVCPSGLFLLGLLHRSFVIFLTLCLLSR